MVMFLEKNTDFKWETRLREFKKEGYTYENGKLGNKIINTVVIRFGKIIKHFIILGLVVFMLLRIVINVYKSYYMLWIKTALYIVAGFLVIFNILYAYTLSTDKVNYNIYLKRWEKIRKKEQQQRIDSRGNKTI